MTRLRGGVNDRGRFNFCNDVQYMLPISDIYFAETSQPSLQKNVMTSLPMRPLEPVTSS